MWNCPYCGCQNIIIEGFCPQCFKERDVAKITIAGASDKTNPDLPPVPGTEGQSGESESVEAPSESPEVEGASAGGSEVQGNEPAQEGSGEPAAPVVTDPAELPSTPVVTETAPPAGP